ncbi:MAG: hypothetical protein K8R49_01895, partial [Candidatus Cloacimonetes bacterium]|nr:hypothetical protein [Candidatus Cloacimonadota bacterium]
GFVEGTGRVIFNGGNYHQYCSNETFNELEINKASGGAFRMNGTNVVCAAYDWTAGAVDVLSGSFTANDLLDNAIQGGFYLNTGGTIDLTNSGTGTWVDLKGDIHIFGGTMTVAGSLSSWPYAEDASIEMSGGVLDITSCGIYLSSSNTLTTTITGGTIKTVGGFTGNRTDFNPTGGTIELYGSADADLSMGAGSNFYNVQINKSSTDNTIGKIMKSSKSNKVIVDRDGSVIELTRANTVNVTSELDINGDLLIDAGTFNLDGNTVNVGDDVLNSGELTVDGTLEISDDFYLYSGSTVDLSGTIHLGTYVGRHGSAIHYSGSTFNQTGGNYYVESINLYNGSQFNGTGGTTHVYVDGHVINNNIDIDDPDSYFYNFYVDSGANAALSGCSYDLEVTYSTNLYGPLDINSYTMNTLYSNVYSGGEFIIDSGGTVNVTGNGPYFSSGGSLTMISGSELNSELNIRFYTGSTENVSGGEIFLEGSFTDQNNIFSPTGGSVTYDGSSASSIIGPTAFYDLNIAKTGATVTANSSFSMTNDLEITSGALTLNGNTVDVANDVDVYGTLNMTNPADILNVGNAAYDNLTFRNGSYGNLTAGVVNLASWLWVDVGGLLTATTGNTMNFNGPGITGIEVDAAGSVFGNINIVSVNPFRLYSISSQLIEIDGNFDLQAGNTMEFMNNSMIVHGLFTDDPTSTVYVYDGPVDGRNTNLFSANGNRDNSNNSKDSRSRGGSFEIDNDFTLTGLMDVGDGDVLLHGEFELASTGTLTIDGGSFISDAVNSRDRAYQNIYGDLNLSAGLFEITNNSLQFVSGIHSVTGGTIRVGEIFYALNAGMFQPSNGEVEMSAGYSGGIIVCRNGNYFHDLIINDGTYISNDIIIQNDFEINAGSFSTNSNNIEIGGDWTNNVGTTGFAEGTGTVTFNGPNEADITTNETFYNLTLDKTNPQYYALEIMDGVTINVTNDLNIADATIEMINGSTLNIANDLNISLNAGLNAFGEPGLNIYVGGNWTNNNTIYDSWKGFYPGTSTVTFNGSAEQIMNTDCVNEEFYNLIVDKSSDYFRAADDIHVLGDLTISNGIWDDYVGGLNHFLYGDVFVASTANWYGSGSTVTFKGTSDQTFEFLGSSYLTDIVVDKTATREKTSTIPGGEEAPIKIVDDQTRSQTVILNSNLLTQGGGTMLIEEGTFNLNGHTAGNYGDIIINNGGTILVDSDAVLKVGDYGDLIVNSGGILQVVGSAAHEAKVTRFSIYDHYDFNVESGGTISADYAIFERMSANGINVKNGAFIDASHSFDNCTFRNGITGGTLLTIDNNQTLTIDNVAFWPNTWLGTYNVSKTLNQGNLTFTNAIGDFAGPDYEYDTYNRIDWDGYGPDLTTTNVVWTDTNPFVCDMITVSITVYNNGNVDIPSSTAFIIDLYYNLGSPPVPFQVGNQAEVVNTGIPAGDFIVIDFDVVNNVAESWNSYVQVDTDGHITELDEGNNVWGPDAITWNGLPAIDDLTIQYNTGTNEIELNWTYPISVDQYKIYRSTDPYDFAGADVFTSSTENYSETVTGTKYFYQVTAERTCTASDNSYKKKTERFSKR